MYSLTLQICSVRRESTHLLLKQDMPSAARISRERGLRKYSARETLNRTAAFSEPDTWTTTKKGEKALVHVCTRAKRNRLSLEVALEECGSDAFGQLFIADLYHYCSSFVVSITTILHVS